MIRLLLIYDVLGWAYEAQCKAIAKHLEENAPGEFDITLKGASSANTAMLDQFDVVFSCVYYHLAEAHHPRSASQICSYSYWIRKDWPDGWPHLTQWQFLVGANQHITEILTPEDHPRVEKLYMPFDADFWRPRIVTHFPTSSFRVGFAGHKNQRLKGVHLIKEAVESLPECRLLTPSWEEGRLTPEQMPVFYSTLDAYVCMSEPGQDAVPRPPVEAGLCGVPVITTKGGQIGEMVVDGENGLVIERTAEALKDALERLRDDVDLRIRIKANIRGSFIEDWVVPTGQAWTDYLRRLATRDVPPMKAPRVYAETPPKS